MASFAIVHFEAQLSGTQTYHAVDRFDSEASDQAAVEAEWRTARGLGSATVSSVDLFDTVEARELRFVELTTLRGTPEEPPAK